MKSKPQLFQYRIDDYFPQCPEYFELILGNIEDYLNTFTAENITEFHVDIIIKFEEETNE